MLKHFGHIMSLFSFHRSIPTEWNTKYKCMCVCIKIHTSGLMSIHCAYPCVHLCVCVFVCIVIARHRVRKISHKHCPLLIYGFGDCPSKSSWLICCGPHFTHVWVTSIYVCVCVRATLWYTELPKSIVSDTITYETHDIADSSHLTAQSSIEPKVKTPPQLCRSFSSVLVSTVCVCVWRFFRNVVVDFSTFFHGRFVVSRNFVDKISQLPFVR